MIDQNLYILDEVKVDFDCASFEEIRNVLDEFEETHINCIYEEEYTWEYGESSSYWCLKGSRLKTEAELEAERLAQEAKEKAENKAREKKERDELAWQKKVARRKELENDPEYIEYRRLNDKFRELRV